VAEYDTNILSAKHADGAASFVSVKNPFSSTLLRSTISELRRFRVRYSVSTDSKLRKKQKSNTVTIGDAEILSHMYHCV